MLLKLHVFYTAISKHLDWKTKGFQMHPEPVKMTMFSDLWRRFLGEYVNMYSYDSEDRPKNPKNVHVHVHVKRFNLDQIFHGKQLK